MHASSFDNDVFDSVIDTTMRGTPLGLEVNNYSDGDSTVSYITGEFPPANPNDLRDATSQTLGHARTQTAPDLWNGSSRDISTQMPRAMQTQTEGMPRYMSRSTQSLQSIGAQTKRSHGSRTDLLKSILMEVKTMKEQRGLDSPNVSEDSRSTRSDSTLKKGMLQELLTDVRTLKDHGAHGEAGTQTLSDQGTQTGMKLFPEGDPVRNARHGRIRDLMDEVKDLQGRKSRSNSATPTGDVRSQRTSQAGTPFDRRPFSSASGGNSPVRFATPQPVLNREQEVPQQNGFHNGYAPAPYMMPPTNFNMTAPAPLPPGLNYPGRQVTQNDINAISDRIQRLQNYQLPPRRTLPPPPPPPPPPQFIVPVYSAPNRRVHFGEVPHSPDDELDGFLSDESEYDVNIAPRRGRRRRNADMDRLGIESALDEACGAAKQLRRMSKKMKDSLRDDLLRG